MKKFFTIKEVARLYGVCPDTLRYYEEQGLLHPGRSAGNYRLYSIADICNLNVIRGLRALDIPVERLRRYFEDCTLAGTLALLDEEEAVIDGKIAALRAEKRTLRGRREKLTGAAHRGGAPQLLALPARPCLRMSEPLIPEPEVDWALRRLALRHTGAVKLLGSQLMGAALHEESRRAGVFDRYDSVFFLGCSSKEADGVLAAGQYASLFYRGAYTQLPAACAALDAFLAGRGLAPAGPTLELYHVDAHDTSREEEYVTELQIRTVPQPGEDESNE